MKKRLIGLMAGAGLMAMGSAAFAADLPVPGAFVAPPPPPLDLPDPVFAWGGLYVGGFGAWLVGSDVYGAGATLGLNIVTGRFLWGAEGQIGTTLPFRGLWLVGGNARAGLLLGARGLLYAEGGAGTTLPISGWAATVGGGLEIALGQNVSLFTEGKAILSLPGFGYQGTMLQAGLNLHLNR